MTPTLIHRYTIPLQQAIELLVGKEATDGEAFLVDVDGDDLVIDIFGPANTTFRIGAYEYTVEAGGEQASNEAAEINTPASEAGASPAEPTRKGGALARQAGIICGEKGFWTFLAKRFGAAISTADEAANWLREDCAIKTRADLDYEPAAAERFKEISRRYGLWLEGYDD